MSPAFRIRPATDADIERLRSLIEASVRVLQRSDYSPEQLDGALGSVFGVDRRLIADGTYLVVESGERIAGCGGWSKRRTLFGSDGWSGREDAFLDPARDAAKIRAFFVHPDFARQGVASMILEACEQAAAEAGFKTLEMGATLTGVPFYRTRGYTETERVEAPLPNGLTLGIVRMSKSAPTIEKAQ